MRIVMQITFANIVRLFPAEAGLAIARRSIIFRLTGLVRLETGVGVADDASVNPPKTTFDVIADSTFAVNC